MVSASRMWGFQVLFCRINETHFINGSLFSFTLTKCPFLVLWVSVCCYWLISNVKHSSRLLKQLLLKTLNHKKGSKHTWICTKQVTSLCVYTTITKVFLIISEWCHGTRLLWVKCELKNIVFKHQNTHIMPQRCLPFPLSPCIMFVCLLPLRLPQPPWPYEAIFCLKWSKCSQTGNCRI